MYTRDLQIGWYKDLDSYGPIMLFKFTKIEKQPNSRLKLTYLVRNRGRMENFERVVEYGINDYLSLVSIETKPLLIKDFLKEDD